MNSPWAMLMTPIWPKVRDSPSAASSSTEPRLSPANICPISTSIPAGLSSVSCGSTAAISGQALGPVVGWSGYGSGSTAAGESHTGVDQAVVADLADPGGLGDVVVLAVHRDRALRRLESDSVRGSLDLIHLERFGLLHLAFHR